MAPVHQCERSLRWDWLLVPAGKPPTWRVAGQVYQRDMGFLEAFDPTRCAWSAAQLVGCDPAVRLATERAHLHVLPASRTHPGAGRGPAGEEGPDHQLGGVRYSTPPGWRGQSSIPGHPAGRGHGSASSLPPTNTQPWDGQPLALRPVGPIPARAHQRRLHARPPAAPRHRSRHRRRVVPHEGSPSPSRCGSTTAAPSAESPRSRPRRPPAATPTCTVPRQRDRPQPPPPGRRHPPLAPGPLQRRPRPDQNLALATAVLAAVAAWVLARPDPAPREPPSPTPTPRRVSPGTGVGPVASGRVTMAASGWPRRTRTRYSPGR